MLPADPSRYSIHGSTPGLLRAGTLNLLSRPTVQTPHGVATVRSITVTTPEGAYLLPTVIGGTVVSNEQAVQHFRHTGQHLGLFASEQQANAYAERLHREQAAMYAPQLDHAAIVGGTRG